MPFIDDDEMVETLLTDGPNPAFCISIGIWRTNWRMNHLDVLRDKNLVKDCGELGVSIME